MLNTRSSLGGTVLVALIVAASPAAVRAQSSIAHVTGGPVLLSSVGNRDYAWQLGGGVEMLSGPLGLGGGVDYVYFPEVRKTFAGGRGGSSSPAASAATAFVQGSYYFGDNVPERGKRPFVNGGVTFLFESIALPMLHVAGGIDWWTTERAGFRFEVREQYPWLLSFRAGVVFR
jgi:hypothetical protein